MKVLKYAAVLVALNLCYLVLMTAVFALPFGARISGNAAESLHVWKEGAETEAPLFGDNRIFWNDTSSEMLLVNCAVTQAGTPPERGVALYYTCLPETEALPPVQSYRNLEAAVSGGGDGAKIETYERYWYLLAGGVRLLLCFLTIGEIRWLLYATGALLALWLFLRVYELLGIQGVLPLALAFVSRTLVLQTATSMTATDVYTACAAMITLTYLYKKPWFAKNRILFYLVTGSVTFAIGPFIAPLLTLGMTLLLDLQLADPEPDMKREAMRMFLCSVAWAAGYALTLCCKTVCSLLAVNRTEASGVAAGYLGAAGGIAGRFATAGSCLYRLLMPVQATLPVIAVFAGILLALIKTRGIQTPKNLLLSLSVACYPVIWALVVAEHSRHDYAVNMFAVTVYGLASVRAGFVKEKT